MSDLDADRELEEAMDQGWDEDDSQAPQPVRSAPKLGRNEPCPCGSGKKYKKCCGMN